MLLNTFSRVRLAHLPTAIESMESLKLALKVSCETYANGLKAMSKWSSLDRIEKTSYLP